MMSLAICSWEGESNDETEPGELPKNDFTCILQATGEQATTVRCFCAVSYIAKRFFYCQGFRFVGR